MCPIKGATQIGRTGWEVNAVYTIGNIDRSLLKVFFPHPSSYMRAPCWDARSYAVCTGRDTYATIHP